MHMHCAHACTCILPKAPAAPATLHALCALQVRLWQSMEGRHSRAHSRGKLSWLPLPQAGLDPEGVLLEVGANIGACTVELCVACISTPSAPEPAPCDWTLRLHPAPGPCACTLHPGRTLFLEPAAIDPSTSAFALAACRVLP